MVEKDKRSIITWLLLGMLGVYLVAIAWINFSETPSFYDADMYSDVLYSIRVWEEKTLFPQNWVFGNQLNVVSAPVLAALFYGILEDAFLAMALAATLMTLLLLWSFDWMLRPAMQDRTQRLLSIVVFMTVVLYYGGAVTDNRGWTLFFTMCAYYAGYSINAFLAFGSYLRAEKGFDWRLIGILILTGLLSFGTGIQSIRQTAIMVVPLVAVEGLRLLSAWIRKKKSANAPLVTVLVITVTNLAGLVCARMVQINQVEILGHIELSTPGQWPAAVIDCFMTVFKMLVNSEMLSYLMLAVLGIICLLALSGLYQKFRQKMDSQAITLTFLLLMGVLVIAGIDILTTMHIWGRYYFLLFPLIGCLVAWSYSFCKKMGKVLILLFVTILFGLSCAEELAPAAYSISNKEQNFAYELSDYLEENGYDYLFSVWTHGEKVAVVSQARIMAAFWDEPETVFKPMGYLYDPVIFEAQPQHCAYLFEGKEAVEIGQQRAREAGTELELLIWLEEYDLYLFKADINLLKVYS